MGEESPLERLEMDDSILNSSFGYLMGQTLSS